MVWIHETVSYIPFIILMKYRHPMVPFEVLQKEHGLASLQQKTKVILGDFYADLVQNIYYHHLDHVKTWVIYNAHREPLICHSIHP